MIEFIYGIFRVLVELMSIQTTRLLLRVTTSRVVVVPWFSWLPVKRMPDGIFAMQEYTAVAVGLCIWGLIAIVLVALMR